MRKLDAYATVVVPVDRIGSCKPSLTRRRCRMRQPPSRHKQKDKNTGGYLFFFATLYRRDTRLRHGRHAIIHYRVGAVGGVDRLHCGVGFRALRGGGKDRRVLQRGIELTLSPGTNFAASEARKTVSVSGPTGPGGVGELLHSAAAW